MNDKPMLVADIGATNARFALCDPVDHIVDPNADPSGVDTGTEFSKLVVLPTKQLGKGADFVAQVRNHLEFDEISAACIGMAGPVENGEGEISNGSLGLQAHRLAKDFAAPTWVANDFFVLAHGVPHFNQLHQVGGEAGQPGVKAVLGAGSGLGMSLLIPTTAAGNFQVLASEGGYADIACTNELEQTLCQLLQQRFSHLCWETVLSGPGLVNIYQALAELWGTKAEPVSPEWITENGINANVPLCHQSLEMFFGFLGAAAGNLALTSYATGGVYIGGGIVPQMTEFAATSPMRRRFEERGSLSWLARRIPIHIILDSHPGLRGARILLAQQLAQRPS